MFQQTVGFFDEGSFRTVTALLIMGERTMPLSLASVLDPAGECD